MSEQHPDLGQLVDLLELHDPILSAHVKTCEECTGQLTWLQEIVSAETSQQSSAPPFLPLVQLLAKQQSQRRFWAFRDLRLATVTASLLLLGLFFLAGYVHGRSDFFSGWLQQPTENKVVVADSTLPVPTVFYDTTRSLAWDWDFSLGALDSL